MVKRKTDTWSGMHEALDALENEHIELDEELEALREEIATKAALEDAAEERDRAIELLRQALPLLERWWSGDPCKGTGDARTLRSIEIFLEDRP